MPFKTKSTLALDEFLAKYLKKVWLEILDEFLAKYHKIGWLEIFLAAWLWFGNGYQERFSKASEGLKQNKK